VCVCVCVCVWKYGHGIRSVLEKKIIFLSNFEDCVFQRVICYIVTSCMQTIINQRHRRERQYMFPPTILRSAGTQNKRNCVKEWGMHM